MPIVDAGWRIISLVRTSDVQMYMLALKSFYSQLGAGRVTLVMDEQFPRKIVNLLLEHFPGIEFYKREDVDTGVCQRGGTWERLVYLIDRSRKEFVIQLDSDTLTVGDITEIKDCIERNSSFCLNGHTGSVQNRAKLDDIIPMSQAAEAAKSSTSDYIGVAFERRMAEFQGSDGFYYVRGSSALAGFACGAIKKDLIDHFHREGSRIMEGRWTEWGTEQSASNFAVANSKNAIVLPYPKYENFDPSAIHPKAAFFHFFGTRRYVGDVYAKQARIVINRLCQ
jgi:hypothetical protein